eukprot:scaffold295614_cov18-Tisochrysis_lutea.AAC.1
MGHRALGLPPCAEACITMHYTLLFAACKTTFCHALEHVLPCASPSPLVMYEDKFCHVLEHVLPCA